VNAAAGRIAGAEALIRWTHAELGEVRPDEFIPLAEETGGIREIGAWALRTACAEAKSWQDRLGAPLSVAVNVSLRQLSDPGFAEYVADCLAATGLPPELLKIEITESTLAADVAGARRTLETLRAAGVHLSLDDFGTGYSSLSYLKQYPIDVLKIDRAFVRDVTENRTTATLAESIIQMAKRLGIRVLAEGVETPEQLQFLRSRGCDLIQGYFFSKPLAPVDFIAYARDSQGQMAA
jgi:EAL domain-containing protein (putative c-di-GMP-specific phosphodiesterase class I)